MEKTSMTAKIANVSEDPRYSSSEGNSRVTSKFHPKFATTATEMALPLSSTKVRGHRSFRIMPACGGEASDRRNGVITDGFMS